MASILFVCTGNICRSPVAEGIVRKRLERVSPAIDVGSVGVVGWEGSGATPEAVEAAAEREYDISAHLARRLSPAHVEGADLVLCMAAEHRDPIVQLDPSATPRTFTLKELVRLLEELPPPAGGSADEVLRERVEDADDLRRSGFEGNPDDEDVSDPIGMSIDMYRAVVWDLDEWCTRLVGALFGETTREEAATG